MTSLSSYVAAIEPGLHQVIEEAKQFVFDADGIRMAHELSLHDWREFHEIATLPFPVTWMEWSPGDYLQGLGAPDFAQIRDGKVSIISQPQTLPGLGGDGKQRQSNTDKTDFVNIERVGMLAYARPTEVVMPVSQAEKRITNGPVFKLKQGGWVGQFFFKFKRQAIPVPTCIIHGQENSDEYSCDRDFLECAWGEPWIRRYGLPSQTHAYLRQEYISEATQYIDYMVREFAGVPRVGLAAMALLNAHREKQVYPESYRAGRAPGRKMNTIPAYKPSVIHLQPNAIRYVMDRSAKEPTGARKREHDVRSHYRQLPGRKVLVRSHKRGDATLGTVSSAYQIEAAPKVIPDNEDGHV